MGFFIAISESGIADSNTRPSLPMSFVPTPLPAVDSPGPCKWEDLSLDALRLRAGPSIDEFVVGGVIRNAEGKFFAQKRSPTRMLFPGCWDIAGGHVEEGETLGQALAREIFEETGWCLIRIVQPIKMFDWSSEFNGVKRTKREFDFIVEVAGDLDRPQLESGKCSEFRWFGPEDTEALKENRQPGDSVIHDIVVAAMFLHHSNSTLK